MTSTVAGWAMAKGDRAWHFYRFDRAACGVERNGRAWTLGKVRAGDCAGCHSKLGQ